MDQTADSKAVEKESKPKKKKHVALWVCLSIFVFLPLTLIGATTGTVHYFFYDSTLPPQPTVAEGYDDATTQKIIKNVGVDSLDNAKTSKQIQLNLSTDDMNNILYGKIKSMFSGGGGGGADLSFIKNFISGIGLRTLENNVCNFEIGAKIPLLKTRAVISTKVEKSGHDISFNIQDCSVGKVTGLFDKLKSIPFAKDLLDDNKLNSILSMLPITLKSDINNNRIVYSTQNISNDISKFLGTSGDGFYNHVLGEFLVNDVYNMNFVKLPDWNGLSATIDLKQLGEDSHTTGKVGERFFDSPKANEPTDWLDYNKLTVKALNAGIISTQNGDENLKAFHEYAIRGYEKCSNPSFIDSLGDLSSIGIPDTHAYMGAYSYYDTPGKIKIPEKSIKDIVTEQIASSEITIGSTISVVNEDQINELLRSSTALGEAFILQRDLADGTTNPKDYKMSTFVISNIYANMYSDNSIDITVTISVNGYPIYLYLRCTEGMLDTTSRTITFKIKNEDMHLGNFAVSQGFKSTIFSLLREATKQESVVEIDSEQQTLTLNLYQAVEDSGKAPLIELLGGLDLHMSGESMSDVGSIGIKVKA